MVPHRKRDHTKDCTQREDFLNSLRKKGGQFGSNARRKPMSTPYLRRGGKGGLFRIEGGKLAVQGRGCLISQKGNGILKDLFLS